MNIHPLLGDSSTGLLITTASFVLVIATLRIDQTATTTTAARHLGFGYPLHLASSDFTSKYGPLTYRQETFRLNPWEIPVTGNVGAFVIDWAAVYVVLLGVALVLHAGLTSAACRIGAKPES